MNIIGRRHGLPQGIPNQRANIDNHVRRVNQTLLWSPTEAVDLYRQSGGHLTEPAGFGVDPVLDHVKYDIRSRAFQERFPSFGPVFHTLVNGDDRLFREGLVYFCDITYRLSCS